MTEEDSQHIEVNTIVAEPVINPVTTEDSFYNINRPRESSVLSATSRSSIKTTISNIVTIQKLTACNLLRNQSKVMTFNFFMP